MTWTKELPTKPGLYAWCDGIGGAVKALAVCQWEGRTLAEPFGTTRFVQDARTTADRGGYWQPIHIELPAPYVPPKPPVVEWYTAKRYGAEVMVAKVGSGYASFRVGDDKDCCPGTGTWPPPSAMYTDIQRAEQ